jgi:hypothetical protein
MQGAWGWMLVTRHVAWSAERAYGSEMFTEVCASKSKCACMHTCLLVFAGAYRAVDLKQRPHGPQRDKLVMKWKTGVSAFAHPCICDLTCSALVGCGWKAAHLLARMR